MAVRKSKALKALAIFLAFGFAQVFVQTGFGSPGTGLPQARLIAARISNARGTILINGNSSNVGTTVLTGAIVETGDQQAGTIEISPLGSFDIEPNSKVQLDFTDAGFRVKVLRGCIRVRSKSNDIAEAYTDEGASEKTSNNKKAFGVCFGPNGQLTQTAAQAAATGGGLSGGALAGIAAAAGATAVVAVVALNDNGDEGRGANPSP